MHGNYLFQSILSLSEIDNCMHCMCALPFIMHGCKHFSVCAVILTIRMELKDCSLSVAVKLNVSKWHNFYGLDVKPLKETQSTDHTVAWSRLFFVHHWTADGRSVAACMLTLMPEGTDH